MAFDLKAEIATIRSQFNEGLWPQMLRSLSLSGMRGWTGQRVDFKFPVTAIVGQNGTGKTTVLKAAACAYENSTTQKSFFPSDFFQQTHWDDLSNIEIEFAIQAGNSPLQSKKIRKPEHRWSLPKRKIKRRVFYFDVGRTLPLDATVGYPKIAKLAAAEMAAEELSDEFLDWYKYLMGRDYERARLATSDVSDTRRVGVVTYGGNVEVSQFHQGAGEDTTFDLVQALQSIPKYSLLLIDEVEASLHPKAQRRVMEFLLWLSRKQRLQVIVSTHSTFVLEQLPAEARVLLMRSTNSIEVIYGASAEFALSKLDDRVHPGLDVYVEDEEAATWLQEILRATDQGREVLGQIAIYPVGPDNVVRTMAQLADAGRLPKASLAVLDGDKESLAGALQLPGPLAPERKVFADLREMNWPDVPENLRTGAGILFEVLEDVMTVPDHHSWTRKVGDSIRMAGRSVWENMTAAWAANCADEALLTEFAQTIADAIDEARTP